jgi:predicted transcriptional regulator
LIGTGASSYATIVDLSSAVTGDRGGYFPIEVNIEGIQADTLTNITSVLVYEKASR